MDLPQNVSEDAAKIFLSTKVDADLAHLFSEAGVPLGLQFRVGQSFTTVRKLAAYADSRNDVRTALETDFQLKAESLEKRAAIAAFISAWESSKEYAAKDASLRAEARLLGVSRPVSQTDRSAMRAAFESSWHKLEESFEPSDDYLSAKMEELEAHEPTASTLDQVTSKKTAKTVGIQTAVDSAGHVRIVKQKKRGTYPQGTEDLRTILRIEGNMWCFLSAKYRTKPMLQKMSPTIWLDFANYLLGEHCFLLKVPLPNNNVDQSALRPPWSVMLSYEYELRKEAIKRAHQGNRPLADTLPEVCQDSELRERFFVGPIALQGRSGSNNDRKQDDWRLPDYSDNWRNSKWARKGGKGKDGKGKGKGKSFGKQKGGKEAGKGSEHSLISMTPDGRRICYAFNAQGCAGSCGMVHVCRVRDCGQPHALWQHFQQLSISDKSKSN